MADSKTSHNQLLVENHDEGSDYSAVFEDDGKVAYAYLLKGADIVADVWLYNHGEPPDEPEWEDPSRMPFANPEGFANPEPFKPVIDASEVGFKWVEGNPPTLKIFIRGESFAKLIPGSKPGWSKLAIRDGPLALVLREDGLNER